MRYFDPTQKKIIKRNKHRVLKSFSNNADKFKIMLIIFAGLIGLSLFISTLSGFNFFRKFVSGPAIMFSFIFDSDNLKSTDGRTNILLLGTGGEGHQGEDLSDTIMVLSINKELKDAALISIPRDFWVDSVKLKINAVYAIAGGKEGNGLEKSKSTISEVLDLPIHYGIRVDFAGFEKIIDTIGGIDVVVDHSFDDYRYPIAGRENDSCGFKAEVIEIDGKPQTVYVDQSGQVVPAETDIYACRFEHVHFEKGLTHMDGATALKFVRSRMGTNGEGSDFARSTRQQKVLLAVKDKVFSLETVFNPEKIISLMANLGKSIDTDILPQEVPTFYKLANEFREVNLRLLVLDNKGEESLLVNPPVSGYYGQWVLVPRNNLATFQAKIKDFILGETIGIKKEPGTT